MPFTVAVDVPVVWVQRIHRHHRCKTKPSHVKCSRELLQCVLQGRRDAKNIQALKERVKQNTGKWGRKLHVGVFVVRRCVNVC